MKKFLLIMMCFLLCLGVMWTEQTVPLDLERGEAAAECYGDRGAGGNYAFAVKVMGSRLSKNFGTYFLYGKTGRQGPFDFLGVPVLSPDGSAAACIARIDKNWFIISGTEKIGPLPGALSAGYNPVTGDLYYCFIENKKLYINVGGELCGPLDTPATEVRFSSDGAPRTAVTRCTRYGRMTGFSSMTGRTRSGRTPK